MTKWIETTGRSEEDAISAALFQLGLDRDDISIEVLQRNYHETIQFINDLRNHHELHQNDPNFAIKHPQFINVSKETIVDYLKGFSAHTSNAATGFIIHNLIEMFQEDCDGVFNKWDVLIAGGSETDAPKPFAE